MLCIFLNNDIGETGFSRILTIERWNDSGCCVITNQVRISRDENNNTKPSNRTVEHRFHLKGIEKPFSLRQ